MNKQQVENGDVGDSPKPKASTNARKSSAKAPRAKSGEAVCALKVGSATNSYRVSSTKLARKSKKDQLIGLLSKPNGTRVSAIVEKLGWQSHTVRAALSGLRKQGINVAASKSPKTGETIYTILPKLESDTSVSAEVQE